MTIISVAVILQHELVMEVLAPGAALALAAQPLQDLQQKKVTGCSSVTLGREERNSERVRQLGNSLDCDIQLC